MTDYSAFYSNQASSDPTRTLTLRSKWVAENNRRFAMLKAVIRKSVVDNDGFGLRERDHFQAQASLPPAAPRQWAYRWSHEKIDAFMKWLKEMEEKSILEIVHRPGTLRPEGEPWTNLYVRSTYQRGLSMAMARVRERSIQMGSLLGLGEADFPPTFLPTGRAISAIMAQPFHADRLALSYTRVFDELKGVSAAMDQQISRELTRGIAQGLNPRDIGDKIADRVEKIGATRGRLIARTETIHVHAQAALNEYYSVEQNTGEVVLIQWSATMDSRTRDTHIERHNRVYTKEEAYALIGEPNCRCALLPYIPAIQGIPEKASDAALEASKKAIEKPEEKPIEKAKKVSDKKKTPTAAPARTGQRDLFDIIDPEDEYPRDELVGQTRNFSNTSKTTLRRYRDKGQFEQINEWLRDGYLPQREVKGIYALQVDLEKVAIPDNTSLWRGVRGDPFADMKVGDTITENGFLSCSPSSAVAANFIDQESGGYLFKMKTKGAKGAYVSERGQLPEYLCPFGSSMKITNIEVLDGGIKYIEVELSYYR